MSALIILFVVVLIPVAWYLAAGRPRPLKDIHLLEEPLKIVTFTDKHIKFWPLIPKMPALSTIEEYDTLESGGEHNVFSGARVEFRLRGKPVAFAAGVTGSEELEAFDITELLSSIKDMQFVPGKYKATFTGKAKEEK